MLDLENPEIYYALNAVRQATLLVAEMQSELVTPALTKDDRSPVTLADFASQALVANLLAKTFPGDPLVGEENAQALQSPEAAEKLARVTHFVSRYAPDATPEAVCNWIDRGGARSGRRFWILDPIDGTKGFLRGDQFVVALALIINGQVEVGILGCPKLAHGQRPDMNGTGSLVVAQRGHGAWTAPVTIHGSPTASSFTRLQVSQIQDPSQARLLRSYEAEHTNTGQVEQISQMLGIRAPAVLMDSQAKYAILAAGGGEAMVRLLSTDKPDYREKIWDQAAGSLVVEEAGGMITDLAGKALDFSTGRTLENNRGVLATNGFLHPAFLQALYEIGA
jgi:3'(2'), 5'-bisphosphate nucleotidase